jgi:hypothetical protein
VTGLGTSITRRVVEVVDEVVVEVAAGVGVMVENEDEPSLRTSGVAGLLKSANVSWGPSELAPEHPARIKAKRSNDFHIVRPFPT